MQPSKFSQIIQDNHDDLGYANVTCYKCFRSKFCEEILEAYATKL